MRLGLAMDNTTFFGSTTFVQVAIAFTVLLFSWIFKRSTTAEYGSNKPLKTYGVVEWILVWYYGILKTYGPDELGRKKSRYAELYNKFVSKSSGYSQEPYLLKIFGRQIVFVPKDYDSILAITKNDAFFDRGPDDFLSFYAGMETPGGFGANNGAVSKELKRFVMKKFGQTGLNKKEMLTSMLGDQLPFLMDRIERLRKSSNNKVQVKGLFSMAVLNVVFILSGGGRYFEDDPRFIELFTTINEVTKTNHLAILFLHFVSHVRGVRELFGYTRLLNLRNKFQKMLRQYVDEKESLGTYKENPNDLLDCFLYEIEKQKNNGDLNYIYCKEQLVVSLQDLYITAMDTTSNFLESVMLFMCLNPDVQEKVQQEIDFVMGTSAVPLYFDCKSRMPYTIATLWEVHRMANITPIIPRMTTRDVNFKGQHIEKGCLVANLYMAMRLDDTYWKDPGAFNPQRFLDENNEIIQERVDRLLIFGNGARVCPGEVISPAVSFTYAVGVLQKFRIEKSCDSEILGMAENCQPMNSPDPFHMSLFER